MMLHTKTLDILGLWMILLTSTGIALPILAGLTFIWPSELARVLASVGIAHFVARGQVQRRKQSVL